MARIEGRDRERKHQVMGEKIWKSNEFIVESASRFLFENNEAKKQTNKQKNEPNQKRQRRKKI